MQEKTHWKKLHNPNYFGCYCFKGDEDIILTVKNVEKELVKDDKGRDSECMIIHFTEDVKPFICNKTNAKMIEKLYKTPYVEEWGGHKLQFYADRNVRFGRDTVEGVRIRPFKPTSAVPVSEVPICEECTKAVTGFNEFTALQIAQRNNAKYGETICIACATKRKKAKDVLTPKTEAKKEGETIDENN